MKKERFKHFYVVSLLTEKSTKTQILSQENCILKLRKLNVSEVYVLVLSYHINKGRDEYKDNGKYSDQGAVGARLDNLLWNSLHSSWKELRVGERDRKMFYTLKTQWKNTLS